MTEIDELVKSLPLRREHQTRAVSAALSALLVRKQRGIVLADEVGCGKTYEALGTMALLWKHFEGADQPIRRVLIVAEPALVIKWFNEIEASPENVEAGTGTRKGFPQYVTDPSWHGLREMLRNACRLDQTGDGGDASCVRESGRHQLPPGRIYITKPVFLAGDVDGATKFIKALKSTEWDVIIVDEAHNLARLHNKRGEVFFPDGTKESRARGLAGRFILALTATPFQLTTSEMLNLLRIVLAPEADIEMLEAALPRFEGVLNAFYSRRDFDPEDERRKRWVDRLEAIRTKDATEGGTTDAPGLEDLLRRHMIRNVKDDAIRNYSMTEARTGTYTGRRFGKLDDVRQLMATSPLVPLHGSDAWVYLHLRDLIADTTEAAAADGNSKPTFIAGDLRQCLSSYEQLSASSLVANSKLPAAKALSGTLEGLRRSNHRHPKVAALCGVVDGIVERELARLKSDASAQFGKIIVFNTLMKTAKALSECLRETVAKKLEPFIDEQLAIAGWESRDGARVMVRAALDLERATVLAQLEPFKDWLDVDRKLLIEAGLESKHQSRNIVDVMFERATNHCSQPLFLLRMARHFAHSQSPATLEHVHDFIAIRVGQRLSDSLRRIVDNYLDDTPADEAATPAENRSRASREIARLAQVLSAPDYVGRFDGETSVADREQRRDNFNRPYSPILLLVSRVGEEGIDLQAHTRYVLHYDVEWNPARMEQREGRVDREGRRRPGDSVEVQFFLLKETYEERVFHTVMQRNAWFEILIGSKRQALAKGFEDDAETPTDVDLGAEAQRSLTAKERKAVMLNLRP